MDLFELFDKVNKTNLTNKHIYNLRLFEYINNLNVHKKILNEIDENKKQLAIDFLNKNELNTSPQEFYQSLNKSKHAKMLTPYSISELSKMKLFKIPNMDIGYALKKYNNEGYKELVAVHNNEIDVSNIGTELVKSAIKNGAEYLDHYDGYLSNFYQSLGFDEIDRDKYDSQYDPDGSFAQKYGKQDVIYRKLKK
jgi:hypothetical protein